MGPRLTAGSHGQRPRAQLPVSHSPREPSCHLPCQGLPMRQSDTLEAVTPSSDRWDQHRHEAKKPCSQWSEHSSGQQGLRGLGSPVTF